MAELPISRLVRIIAKLEDASDPILGTGFRLGPTRVLTAFHVVRGAAHIEVKDKEGTKWIASEAATVWPAPDAAATLDVAVLSTAPPKKVKVWTRHAEKALSRRLRWDSCGFPATAQKRQVRRGIFGTALEFSDDETRFELTVSEGIPKDVKDWQGISGAPVFIEGYLHGVIVNGPRQFQGERLNVVPLTALRKQEGFLQAIIEAEVSPGDHAYVEQVEKLLRVDDRACAEISAQDDRWRPPEDVAAPQRARWLAEAICRRPDLHRIAPAPAQQAGAWARGSPSHGSAMGVRLPRRHLGRHVVGRPGHPG